MKTYAKAYLMFLAMSLVTAMVVRPLAVKSNIPLLKDI